MQRRVDLVTEIFLLPLMVYAACGLVLSLAVHLSSFFGIVPKGNVLFFALHIGIFPLWIPVVLISQKMAGGRTRQQSLQFFKIALSGCPSWMRVMTYGFFIYALINFAIFFAVGIVDPPPKQMGPDVPVSVFHGFSGHWMAFYSAGLAILTTAYKKGLSNLQRRCKNGHQVGWNDTFCPACGALVDLQQAP